MTLIAFLNACSLPDWPVIIGRHASREIVRRQLSNQANAITKKPRPRGAAVQQGGRFVMQDLHPEQLHTGTKQLTLYCPIVRNGNILREMIVQRTREG
ncbi:hypothetical protein [Paracoccus homiensis]